MRCGPVQNQSFQLSAIMTFKSRFAFSHYFMYGCHLNCFATYWLTTHLQPLWSKHSSRLKAYVKRIYVLREPCATFPDGLKDVMLRNW